KRIIVAVLSLITIISLFAGCGKTEAKRELFNVNLSKYVDLGEYKGIEVDTKSDSFKEFYNDLLNADIQNAGVYKSKTEGTVAEGDIANINYTGKKDGVAFEGGTAENFDLTIGSHQFIDGFEDGLIGVAIGDTVDLNLTFPEDYQEELAGKDVVFTVKVNFVKTTDNLTEEDCYEQLGYSSLEKYKADLKENALNGYILDAIEANSTIKKYIDKDTELVYSNIRKNYASRIKSSYDIEFSEYLANNNYTEAQYKQEIIKNQVEPFLDDEMIIYAIFDKEKMSVSQEEIDKEADEMLAEIKKSSPNVTQEQIKEYYGDFTFECRVVNEKVYKFLTDNANIK
ncbi:MAG: FKBP-type peptidyl-prolyl cis-trans isomerase, partial [Clostridia bacterium]|nr:FKBP-type peptidyl-prolyl cis-trans isomerase [Clostridia bacterium]